MQTAQLRFFARDHRQLILSQQWERGARAVADEKQKNNFVHLARIMVSHGFSALNAEQRKTVRNTLIKTGTVLDLAASASYGIAGLFLNDLWMPAASIWFVVSDNMRLSKRQGPEVPFPHFEKDIPLRERISGYTWYAKEVYANNPNLQAESFAFPGVMVSLIGLSYVLPPEQMAVFFLGYGTASAGRAASIAIQETEEEKKTSSQPKNPEHLPSKRWWSIGYRIPVSL